MQEVLGLSGCQWGSVGGGLELQLNSHDGFLVTVCPEPPHGGVLILLIDTWWRVLEATEVAQAFLAQGFWTPEDILNT